MSATTDTAAQAQEFVRENEPLLAEAGPSTLQRMVVQASEILVPLSEEVVRAANELTDTTNQLTAAIKDPKVPPKRVHALEVQESRLRKTHNRKSGGFERLSGFTDRASALYEERLVLDVQEAPTVEEELLEAPAKLERRKPGLFARLFGHT